MTSATGNRAVEDRVAAAVRKSYRSAVNPAFPAEEPNPESRRGELLRYHEHYRTLQPSFGLSSQVALITYSDNFQYHETARTKYLYKAL